MRYWQLGVLCLGILFSPAAPAGGELIPPRDKLKADRPRMLLRPADTPTAISLGQLKAIPRDAEFQAMLAQIAKTKDAACQAMVYLLTGDKAAADKAIQRLRSLKSPDKADSFAIYFTLREAALAYDWLTGYDGLTRDIKAEVRRNLAPIAAQGAKTATDHIFHNYTWMAAGGTMLWALATAGDDPEADKLFETMRTRLNRDLYPGMEYLNGQFGESPGYWTLYDLSPCALTVLAAQSATEADLATIIRKEQRDWLARQLLNVVCMTLPNMRYVTWGDIQSGGDGGVTHEVAGVLDGVTWATGSPEGVHFSQWLAKTRGLLRFYEFHGIFYFLYTRQLKAKPAEPPLAFLAGRAGDSRGGAMLARSGWSDSDTLVAFRCTDFFGGHNHFDQGSFVIHRNGHLACDPDLYKHVGGSQQPTNVHNTLLIDGKGQRPLRAQWFKDVADFTANLTGGKKLETGDIVSFRQTPGWVAVAGSFGQAYPADQLEYCVRQLLFVRPGTVLVVDHLAAPAGKTLGQVTWQLMLAAEPKQAGDVLSVSNGKSYLTCRPLLPGKPAIEIAPSIQKTHRAALAYTGENTLLLVHLLAVGDGDPPADPAEVPVKVGPMDIQVVIAGQTFILAREGPFEVKIKY